MRMGLRILLSALIGIIVGAGSLLAAWQSLGNIAWDQRRTASALEQISRAAAAFREAKGRFPNSLSELAPQLKDGWVLLCDTTFP